MKKLLPLILLFGTFFQTSAAEFVEDSVSLGTSGADQVWYSLENGEAGRAKLNEWHLGFVTEGMSADLFFNDAAGNTLKVYPGGIEDWDTFDTTGYYNWTVLNNGYNSWKGAFSYASSGAQLDYGWGAYSIATHNLTGTRIFVVKIGTEFRKLKVDELLSRTGDYTITTAKLDGSDEQVIKFNKNAASGKLLGYIDILTGKVLDREPAAGEWDLVFTKYLDLVSDIRYGVTGILQNDGVTVATATPVDNPEEFTDTTGLGFSANINAIGYDWKAYVFAEGKYVIEDSTVYFVKAKTGAIWRVIMTGYASAGTVQSFKKAKLEVSTGIADRVNNIALNLSLYPNPAANGQFTIAYDVQKAVNRLSLDIIDLSGRTVYSQQLSPAAGFRTQNISAPQLSSGMYIVRVSQDGNGASQKLIIK